MRNLLTRKNIISFFTCLLLIIFFINANAQVNTIDPSFNPTDPGFGFGDGSGAVGGPPRIFALAKQTDGKIIAGGNIYSYNGVSIPRGIIRLNMDGSIDNNFQPSAITGGNVKVIAIQADGKIVIAGDFNFGGRSIIVRLNADGSLDNNFNPIVNGEIDAVAVMNNGKIIIGGFFTTVNGTGRSRIAMLNPDGSLDAGFDPGTGFSGNFQVSVRAIAIQADLKIMIGGSFNFYNGNARNGIIRIDAAASIDNSFDPGSGTTGFVSTMIIQPDQKILIGGSISNYNGTPTSSLVRILSNGSRDASFNSPSTGNSSAIGPVYSIVQQSDGKIIAGGGYSTGPNVYFHKDAGSSGAHAKYEYIARFDQNGNLDLSFGPYGVVGANSDIHALLLQDDGQLLVGGDFSTFNLTNKNALCRLSANGNLDMTFNPPTGSNSTIMSILRQGDGKLLIGGYLTAYNGVIRHSIARVNADGNLDPTFDPGRGAMVEAQTPAPVLAMALQTDGKVLVGGYFTNFSEPNDESNSYVGPYTNLITRLNGDGSLDNTFHDPITYATQSAFTINSIVIQPDGKIVIGGLFVIGSTSYVLARLNADGTVDNSFTKGIANGVGYAMTIDANGNILIGGAFTIYNGVAHPHILRLDPNGNPDINFSVGTGPNSNVNSVFVQNDGNILICGNFTQINGSNHAWLARLTSTGGVDNTYSPTLNNEVDVIVVLPDDKTFIGGYFTTINGTSRNRVAKLKIDGTLDLTFNPCAGANGSVHSLFLNSADKLFIGGDFTSFNNCGRNRIARIYVDTLSGNKILSAQNICFNSSPATLNTDIAAGGLDCQTYTFQWQKSSDGITFTNVNGATNESFNPGNLTVTTWYRRKATHPCGVLTSNAVKITVYPQLSGNTVQSDQIICYSTAPNTIQTNAPAAGGDGTFTYQWQSSDDENNFSDVSNATSESFAPGTLTSTTWYRRKAINLCGTLTSNVVKVTVYPQLSGNTVQSDQTVCYNTAPNIIQTNAAATGGDGTFTYQWQSSSDGTNFSDLNNATDENLSPGNLTATTWYRRNAVNLCGTLTSNAVQVIVLNNQPPVANAGGPYTADLGSSVVFDGTGSTDPNISCGDFISYAWDINNDGVYELSGMTPTVSSVIINALGVGSHSIRLRVTDSFGDTAIAVTILTIYDNRPFANFTSIPNPAGCNQSITFDGSSSYHGRPDRSIVSYTWDFGDNTTATGMIVTHAYTPFGTYIAKLTVTDNNVPAQTSSTTANINVNLGNQPPVANAGGPYTADLGSSVVLDGTGSTDPNISCGDYIVSYAWDINNDGVYELSGMTPTVSSVIINALGVGSHSIRLRVTDSFGDTAIAVTILTIYDNRPFANFTSIPNPAGCNQSITFDGSSSYHGRPDRSIVSYTWDFGDNTTATGMIVTHAYTSFGTYIAKLTVADNNVPAQTSSTTANINVNLGNQPPVANAGGPYTVCIGNSVTLNGMASTDPNISCGDYIVSYEWDINNDGVYELGGMTSTVSASVINALGIGSYSIRLRVTDSFGDFSSATTTLTVNSNVSAGIVSGSSPLCIEASATYTSNGTAGGTWSSTNTSVATVNSITGVVTAVAAGTTNITYTINSGCGSPAYSFRTLTVTNCTTNNFQCSYDQGYYGNVKGSSCNGSTTFPNNAALLIQLLGSGNVVAGRSGYSVIVPDRIAGLLALIIIMPGGGTPAALNSGNCMITGSCINSYLRNGRINNVLLSQTIALTLNTRLNSGSLLSFPVQQGWLATKKRNGCGISAATVSCSSDPNAIISYMMNANVVNYLTNNGANTATVQSLLDLANDVLGRVKVPGANGVPSFADINAAVDVINKAFNGCRVFLGYYNCEVNCANIENSCNLPVMSRSLKMIEPEKIENVNKLTVIAFPNPYNGFFKLNIKSPVSGMAKILFYNTNGSKLFELNHYVQANIDNIVEIKTPVSFKPTTFYKVMLDNYEAHGIVIKLSE